MAGCLSPDARTRVEPVNSGEPLTSQMAHQRNHDICIIGGAGHVGLPLALVFARAGQRVLVHDLNRAALETIKGGTMPFIEYGAEPLLASALRDDRLVFSSDARDIARA